MSRRERSYYLLNIIFAGIIVIIMIYSGLFSPEKNDYPVQCTHMLLTGKPCPSCGLSRSFSYIIRGNLSSAYQQNIYGLRVFVFFILQLFLRLSNAYSLKFRDINYRGLIINDIVLSLISFGLGFSQFIAYTAALFFT